MDTHQFRIDVSACGSPESVEVYPKYARDEVRAHALAEEAALELRKVGRPGEYFVVVSENGSKPISTQVVVVSHSAEPAAGQPQL
jgi:hypothetical protein